MDLKAAKEGSWRIFLSKVGLREEAAVVIEPTNFFVCCLGLSGLQKKVEKCQVLGLALSHAEAAFQRGSGASAQGGGFFQLFYSFLHLLFWVVEALLLACIFMRILWALMAGPPSHPLFLEKPKHHHLLASS